MLGFWETAPASRTTRSDADRRWIEGVPAAQLFRYAKIGIDAKVDEADRANHAVADGTPARLS